MHLRSARHCLLPTLLALLAVATTARAQAPPFTAVHTLAAATTGVPIEHTFSVTTAGNYTITLTDLGAAQAPPLPSAPLASVKLAVTSGSALVGAPLVGAGTLNLNSLAAGNYTLHVVGMPGNPGSGPIGIVVNGPGNNEVASYQDVIALPSNQLPNGEAVLDPQQPFMVQTSGTYTVTLTDLNLPQALNAVTLAIIQAGAGPPPLVELSNGPPAVWQWTGTLNANVNYQVFAIGQASAAANAGLFTVVISSGPPGGPVVKHWEVPVGNTTLVGSPTLKPSAANGDSFVLTDLSYPAALQQLQGVLIRNGQVQASLAAAGSASFTAAADTYEAYAVGVAATAGSYALQVVPAAGAALFSVARPVTASGGALTAYSFDTSLPAAGSYTVSLADFQLPTALTSLELGAVQNAALLGKPLAAAGSESVSGASGPLSLLVFAQSTGSGGLFGVDVAPSAGGSDVFDVTQGVGGLFSFLQVPISAAGSYSVTASDLAFPAKFANYDTIVTHGTKSVGYIFGGGTFNFAATPGIYSVNFIAQPGGSDEAGTYALAIATAPPAPVVNLSVDNPQVSSGSTVDIVWSSQNATMCTASGGWSGNKALSGTATSSALTTNTTFTLKCTGAGGAQSESVTVTVTAASGGGGAIGAELLALLLGVLGLRLRDSSPKRHRRLAQSRSL
jgi:hypothetical protein